MALKKFILKKHICSWWSSFTTEKVFAIVNVYLCWEDLYGEFLLLGGRWGWQGAWVMEDYPHSHQSPQTGTTHRVHARDYAGLLPQHRHHRVCSGVCDTIHCPVVQEWTEGRVWGLVPVRLVYLTMNSDNQKVMSFNWRKEDQLNKDVCFYVQREDYSAYFF